LARVPSSRVKLSFFVVFTRVAFSWISSFAQNAEPIYDAFNAAGAPTPSDAHCVESGNFIPAAKVNMSLFSGFQTFKAYFLDI